MFDNSIRGGQIFIHQIRMFRQIAGYAAFTALLCGLAMSAYLNIERFDNINWHASLTYFQGAVIDKFDDIVPSFGSSPSDGSKYQMNINITKGFGKAEQVPIKEFMKMKYFIHHGDKLFTLIITFSLYALGISFTIFLTIFTSFGRFGKFAKETKQVKGGKVHTAKEVLSYLRANKIASDLFIGDMPLVKESETKHILITGSTGSGKSNCLHILLPQIRSREEPAIVVDTEGSMVERYYRPGKDIILNPFDARSHSWDFWGEIDNDRLTEKVASAFFPEAPSDSYSGDKRWNSWGRMLFLGAIEYLKKTNNKTVEALFHLLHKESIEVLADNMKGTDISGLLDSKSSTNSAPHNIRMNTMEATKWLKYFMVQKEGNSLCFRTWFNELDEAKDDRWIFITCDRGDAEFLLPFISTVMDIALSSLISLQANSKRRVWFIMDELAKLRYMPTLEKNITLLRKYGGCVLAATQSFKQLFIHYGKNSGSIMLSQFNTNIIFKILDSDDAQVIAKRVGNIEILSQQKNTSYGAHEHRDGISYTEQQKSKALIDASDLAKLEQGEAYVLLPEPSVALSKINTKPASTPKETQPDFILDPEVELLLLERQKTWKQKSDADAIEVARAAAESKKAKALELTKPPQDGKQKASDILKTVEIVNKDLEVEDLKMTSRKPKSEK